MGLKRTNQPKMLFLYDCSKNDDLRQFGYWFGERRKARAAGGLRSASQSNTQLGWRKLESLSVTLATLMGRVLQKQPVHAAKRRLPIRFSAECENWRVESKSFKKISFKA